MVWYLLYTPWLLYVRDLYLHIIHQKMTLEGRETVEPPVTRNGCRHNPAGQNNRGQSGNKPSVC